MPGIFLEHTCAGNHWRDHNGWVLQSDVGTLRCCPQSHSQFGPLVLGFWSPVSKRDSWKVFTLPYHLPHLPIRFFDTPPSRQQWHWGIIVTVFSFVQRNNVLTRLDDCSNLLLSGCCCQLYSGSDWISRAFGWLFAALLHHHLIDVAQLCSNNYMCICGSSGF